MDLKDLLPIKGGNGREHYWALVVEPGWVQAGIWEIGEARAQVISISPSTPWEGDDNLVSAADTALSAAIQNLPEDTEEPQKTVFGVPPSWVSEGEIKKEYLEKIRKICADLSLTPSGFVVLPEAISNLIKSKEGTPLNGIVIGFDKENIEVAVFKLGTLSGITQVARSVSVADDVQEGLARFGLQDTLPSRFLIYDGREKELEDTRQSLLAVSWVGNAKVKFLHTPKIEIISPNDKVLATALAGASEIANVSLVTQGAEKEKETANVEGPAQELKGEELGFVVGEDIAGQAPETVGQEAPKETFPVRDKVLGFISKIKTRLFVPPTFGEGGPLRMLTIGGITLAVFLIVGFILWWFLPKATVTIFVSPKKIENKLTILADEDANSPDFSKALLPAKVLETEISGEKTKTTTGKKTVGDKAKGTVKIGNSTPNIVNLPAGTVLIAANDLRFVTDKAASISAGLDSFNPGTANVDVVASDIGSQYNLAKDETFKIGNYPKAEVSAQAIADFSGGSSREISAVSQEDQRELEESLTDELILSAKNEFSQGLSSDRYFIKEAIVASASSKAFSHKIGDEASNLKLDLTLSVSGLTVEKTRLFELAKNSLSDNVPDGFVLRDEQLGFVFSLEDTDDGVREFEVLVSANLLPEVKPDEIAKKIAGKYPTHAESFLTTIAGFTRAEIKPRPKLPGWLGTLPHIVRNITVEISAER